MLRMIGPKATAKTTQLTAGIEADDGRDKTQRWLVKEFVMLQEEAKSSHHDYYYYTGEHEDDAQQRSGSSSSSSVFYCPSV